MESATEVCRVRFQELAAAAYPNPIRVEMGGALWMSLPGRPMCLTAELMQAQLDFGGIAYFASCGPEFCHYPVAFGDQVERPSLLGRGFYHGITDCWSLCRHYYLERDVFLPEYPRDWGWWKTQNIIEDNAMVDFRRVDSEPLEEGDLIGWLFPGQVRMTHSSVYLGNDQVLHHTTKRNRYLDPTSLSEIVPMGSIRGNVHSKWRPQCR